MCLWTLLLARRECTRAFLELLSTCTGGWKSRQTKRQALEDLANQGTGVLDVTGIQAGWIGFLADRERAASPGEKVGAWLSRSHMLLHMHLLVDNPPEDLTGEKDQKISSLTLVDLEQSGGVLAATQVPSPTAGDG